MSTNFTSDPLSDAQIVGWANHLRQHHGLGDHDVPDVVAMLEYDTIPTRFGMKAFAYQVVSDEELGGDEAITIVSSTHVRVRISQSTMKRARALDCRSRMTLAHELMHGVLHQHEAPLARARETRARIVSPHVSIERQANVGASAYLVTDEMLKVSASPQDLAKSALVSFGAADIRWEQKQKRLHRGDVAAALRTLAVELKQEIKPAGVVSKALLLCPGCGDRCLQPIGVKYLCTGRCDQTFDGFADGDGPIE
jgi:hypothetical protein